MILILLWISLITLITSQHVHSKVITINTAGGSDNTTCCVNGECVCTSLSTALLYITSNTVVDITSESVTLEDNIKMGSGDLNNITITGNGATIMCNNSGGVYCESCDNVVIEGITWDKCGDPDGTHTAGVIFNITSNISLLNCTFQYSQITAASLQGLTGTLTISHTNFTSNIKTRETFDFGALVIMNSEALDDITIYISDSNFYNNKYVGTYTTGGIYVDISGHSLVVWIKNTVFSLNSGAVLFHSDLSVLKEIHLIGINAVNNSEGFVYLPKSFLPSNESDILVVESSVFSKNSGSCIWWIVPGDDVRIIINNSTFIDNEGNEPIIGIEVIFASTSTVNFTTVNLISNTVAELQSIVAGVVSILPHSGDIALYMTNVNFVSNGCLKYNSAALVVRVSPTDKSKFVLLYI